MQQWWGQLLILAEVVLDLTRRAHRAYGRIDQQVCRTGIRRDRFGSNVRSGAAYRKAVCRVLVKRALETWKGEQI